MLEPLVPLGVALHGVAVLWLGAEAKAWQFGALAAVVVLGLIGAAGFRSQLALFARGLVVAAATWPIAAFSGGVGSEVTIWFAAAVVVYPVVLTRRLGRWYPPLATAAYVALSTLPDSTTGMGEVVVRGALLLGGGYLVWMLASSSEHLADERARAETEARVAQGRFRAAFANAPGGMALVGLRGEVLQANQALADFLQTDLDSLHRSDWRHLLHPDDIDSIEAQVDQLASNEIWSFQREVRCIRSDGRVVWAVLGMSLVSGDEHMPEYVFAHFQDLTGRMLVEAQLRLSEEHYRHLFGRSPVPIWEQDFTEVGRWLDNLRARGVTDLRAYLTERPDVIMDGVERIRIIDVNDAAMRLVEAADRSELMGGLAANTFTQDALEAVVEQFVAIWEGRDRIEIGLEGRTLRGNRIDVILHWVAPKAEGRLDLSKVVVAFADITEYRRTEEALRRIEERLRTVVSAAPIVLFALDRHGVFSLAEGEGLGALGLRPGEAVGRSVFELFRDAPQLVSAVRRSLAGESFTTSVQIRSLDFDIRFNPIWEDGKVGGLIGVANDITVRKRTTERLEQLLKSKDEFVATVSHELRTPLTAVVGFAQELRSSLHDFSKEEMQMFVSLIADQSLEMADLVEDLLVAARADIAEVPINPEPVDLVEQIESVMASMRDGKRPTLRGTSPKAFVDPIRLRQILRNLLSNAERYGGDDVVVELAQRDEFVIVRVIDDGTGIPEREREKIFEPYQRAHQMKGQPASVGLGLTVSRQLARRMGGDLTYSYEQLHSIFELAIPAME